MKQPQLWIIWGNWGPYHHARFTALRSAAAALGVDVRGVELVPRSDIYEWQSIAGSDAVWRLPVNEREMDFRPLRLARMLRPLLRREHPVVVFVPSYWHWSLECNLLARAVGARIVMMNESHAGTERAQGLKRWIKRQIVRRFHAALVGGTPHKRHFASLGLAENLIATGYDAVDNDFFARKAAKVRQDAASARSQWGLPLRYVLSLGRFVEKKNLATLVEAHAMRCADASDTVVPDLVVVGSGPLDGALREQCRASGIEVVERSGKPPFPDPGAPAGPRAFFYGFRQIEENPVFYALAEAFVLPSAKEEWGLVVNEAMACGLPVIVSRTAGCAEDLVRDGGNGWTFDPSSPGDLAACLARLNESEAERARMGARSVEIIAAWGCEAFAAGALAAARACAPELFAR
ncbi:MAG TPA: glycosyltransferase family 4 protein [Opitutaceae bacterium]